MMMHVLDLDRQKYVRLLAQGAPGPPYFSGMTTATLDGSIIRSTRLDIRRCLWLPFSEVFLLLRGWWTRWAQT
jgi:hypothetical protein